MAMADDNELETVDRHDSNRVAVDSVVPTYLRRWLSCGVCVLWWSLNYFSVLYTSFRGASLFLCVKKKIINYTFK